MYSLERLNVLTLLYTMRFYASQKLELLAGDGFLKLRAVSAGAPRASIARLERWRREERTDALSSRPRTKAVGIDGFLGYSSRAA